MSADIATSTVVPTTTGLPAPAGKHSSFGYFQYAPTSIIVAEAGGKILDANPAALRLLGYDLDTIREMCVSELHAPTDCVEVALDDPRLVRSGCTQRDIKLLCKDRRVIVAGMHAVVLENGHVVAFFEDITEKKRSERELQESEGRFREFFNQITDAVAIHAIDGEGNPGPFLEVNDATCKMLGQSREELLRRSPLEFRLPAAETRDELKRRLLSGETVSFEHTLRGAGQREIPVEIRARLFPFHSQPALIAICCDITERKQGELRLIDSERNLGMALAAAEMGTFDFNLQTRVTTTNFRHDQIFGYNTAQTDWGPEKLLQHVHPDDRGSVRAALDRTAAEGRVSLEFRVVCPDQSVRWISALASGVYDENGLLVRSIGTVQDITQRKLTEEAIRRSEERFRSILAATAEGVVAQDTDGKITVFNARAQQILGRTEEELLGATPHDPMWGAIKDDGSPFTGDDYPAMVTLRTGKPLMDVVMGILWPNGQRRWISISSQPMVNEHDGRIEGAVTTFLDITARQVVEQELTRLRQLLEAFVTYAPVAIAMLDREMRYIRTSRKWRQELDLPPDEPMAGRLHYETIPNLPEKWKEAHRRGLAGETVMGDDGWTTSGGREVWYHWEVHPWGEVPPKSSSRPEVDSGGIMVLFEDVMKQRQLQAQLRQAQKMEAVGQLAGGVAHDFNNLLQVIIGYGELLQDQLAGDEASLQKTNTILEATRRATRLTHQLLAFSRKQLLHPVVVDLNTVVESTTKMLKRLLPENIEFRVELSQSLWLTEVDPDQMAHVLINLAVNARDAMPHGGTLTIATKNVNLSPGTQGVPPAVKPGRYVIVTVRDTGMGIDAESMRHLFEPFYTTKPKGKGTGLGLASVYGILKQSSGFVWAESSPGRGACFTVCLPRTDKVDSARVRPILAARETDATLLVVDDDSLVRDTLAAHATSLGYKVLTAAPDAALKVALQRAQEINLLITDIVMPGTSGPELAAQVKAINPRIKIVFISGYVDSSFDDPSILRSQGALLHKPFGRADLALKIKEALAT